MQTFEDSLLDLIIRYEINKEIELPAHSIMYYLMSSLNNLQEAFSSKEQNLFDADPGEMDGDHESGLASAGWGTDENYGGTDERY